MTTALHAGALRRRRARCFERPAPPTVLDLGCGEGAFLLELAMEPWVERVLGLDVSASALATLAKALEALPSASSGRWSCAAAPTPNRIPACAASMPP
jgi:methylase of polypeptide subunit release factors